MKILITAGNTQIPIDRVRCIANVFKGTTGALIAVAATQAGHQVTLVTSSPEVVPRMAHSCNISRIVKYTTFDELANILEAEVRHGGYDVVIHSAAVSDYGVSGVMVPGEHGGLTDIDASSKVSGSHPVMFLRLEPLPKLIDRFRRDYGFNGTLVKFKLQVGLSDQELLEIAAKSRTDSSADLIVANCLEWSRERAYIIGPDGLQLEVRRPLLATTLLEEIGKLKGAA